jgi:NADH-quinone oxidoreductase subunit H
MQDVAMMMVLGGVIAVTLFIPVPGMSGLAERGDLLVLVYLMMVPSLGLAMGVGSTANAYGSVGISRALTAMLAYDVPLMIAIAGAAIAYGTTALPEIVAQQQAGGIATWGIAQMPLLAVAALLAVHAMLGKEPFEIYVAPAEIASGPMTEMSGKYLGTLFTMQSFQLYIAGSLYTVLFLGGGSNWLTFLVKVFAVVLVCVTITNLYPRYRADKVVMWMWKWPTAIALLGLASVLV